MSSIEKEDDGGSHIVFMNDYTLPSQLQSPAFEASPEKKLESIESM